jgi:beta-glucosidase
MEAAEVVQVYLEPPGLLLERPQHTLVAFQRLSLAAGEQRRLVLRIPLRQLACFDPQRDAFVLEGGQHRLVVGRHAEDSGQAVCLELQAAVLGP